MFGAGGNSLITDHMKIVKGVSAVALWVKNLALPRLWLRSALWPPNSHRWQVQPPKKEKQKEENGYILMYTNMNNGILCTYKNDVL